MFKKFASFITYLIHRYLRLLSFPLRLRFGASSRLRVSEVIWFRYGSSTRAIGLEWDSRFATALIKRTIMSEWILSWGCDPWFSFTFSLSDIELSTSSWWRSLCIRVCRGWLWLSIRGDVAEGQLHLILLRLWYMSLLFLCLDGIDNPLLLARWHISVVLDFLPRRQIVWSLVTRGRSTACYTWSHRSPSDSWYLYVILCVTLIFLGVSDLRYVQTSRLSHLRIFNQPLCHSAGRVTLIVHFLMPLFINNSRLRLSNFALCIDLWLIMLSREVFLFRNNVSFASGTLMDTFLLTTCIL